MGEQQSARSILQALASNSSHQPAETPLLDWVDGVAQLSVEHRSDIAEKLIEADGEVVCHFETDDQESWLRYIPRRNKFEWKIIDKETDESQEWLESYRGDVDIWLQGQIKAEAEASIHRPADVSIEFGDPDREPETMDPLEEPEKTKAEMREEERNWRKDQPHGQR